MLKMVSTTVLSGLFAASVLLAASSLSPVGAAPALAPSEQITRNTMLESIVELQGGTYEILLAELIFEPGAETPVHVHPGPSAGFLQSGRVAVSLAGTSSVNTYAGGSAIHHPWDVPHVFRNNGEERVRMLSFEIIPVSQ